ncbi:MAG: hypothetical protein LBB90_10450 [Tannerella sp.]|jgi:hypothetical protein|nr:hypothetical protein [Tannerella sp.]
MSYREALHTPYQLLLMMQHDRIRVDYGAEKDEVVKVSGKELLKKKMERR